MPKKNSDLLYFSVLFLLAFFAGPVIAGPCLALEDCTMAVTPDCGDEHGESMDSWCCDVTGLSESNRQTIKLLSSSLIAAIPQIVGDGESSISSREGLPGSHAPPLRDGPLFVLHSSFLI
ncbi:MAG: hypothetical protein HKN37_13760 [Rhodothermales bacterium]|nr:hypothetical protein [Rhodothermales bacterium]